MNQQIQELAKQAGAEFWQRLENDVVKENAYITFDPPESLEKFAELIVRECMTQIQHVREIKAGHAGPEYTQGFDDGMFVAISTIEEHFGVEE